MNNALNYLIAGNGYPLSVALALSFHALLLLVVHSLQSIVAADSVELVQPTIIKALFIDENPQVVNQRNLERQRLRQDLAQQQQREAVEQEQQRQAEARRREQEQEAARQQQQREAVEQEQQRQAAQRELAAQQEAERQRQAQQEEQERQRQQAEQEQRLQAQAAAAAEAARNEFELVQSATGLIRQVVQENWSRPPSARNGMRAILRIRLLPTGELLEVSITESSGDPAFDRSAETAVYRAAPFTELNSLPIAVFNAHFRFLSLVFAPDDLLN